MVKISLSDRVIILRSCLYYSYNIFRLIGYVDVSQYKFYNEIRDEQMERLIKLIANSDIHYYQNASNNNITIDNILDQSIYLTKQELRENFDKIYHKTDKEFFHITSGSTGQPLKVISSGISEAHRFAHRFRFYDWWGIRPWDRNILVWGEMSTTEIKKEEGVLIKAKNFIKRPEELFISVFDLDENSITDFYKNCLSHNAVFIRGYASGVYSFCLLLQKKKLNGRKLNLKLAITTSEILFEDRRSLIEEVLGCRVANEYGAAEIGLFACECPSGSMHINEELVFLQTTRDGDLLVTDLHNTATPLINYEIGDRIKINDTPCSCGRGLRVIESITGREGDLVLKPDGEYASQYIFYYSLKEIGVLGYENAIAQYKVIQEKNHFRIYIVKGSRFSESATNAFIDLVKEKIGQNISFSTEYVNEIPREKSGKIRFFQRIDS
ncbi:MAG: hypothetical protein WAW07_05465 [Bacteroidales bacterium]